MEQVPRDQGAPDGVRDCYRHPGRPTGISCTRCERPICTDCMVSASVGFQCPECVRTGSGTGHRPDANRPRNLAGGAVADGDPVLVTKVLIALNVAVYGLAFVLGDRFVDALYLVGQAINPATLQVEGVAQGEWYRLLTATFLHEDLVHIAFNMLALWVFGGMVERHLGRSRYLVLYLLSGLGGSVLAYLVAAPNQPSLGASGAVFGLLGAVAVLSRRLREDMRPIVILIVVYVIFSFRGGISWEGHLGGLVTGVLVSAALVFAPRERRRLVQYGGCALVLLVLLGASVVRSAALT
ncbi:rhomboid family intramembrane serine protease [Streptomyces sp. NPDC060194]|uniref:rhomboid family intramembrane serine protease n=1 Tax=Streptomyces sp. NPDC060194 TaxID=3347069 RepID=UPI00365C7E0D